MVGLLLGAAILGLIIAAMEREEFPGWGKMFFCVLGAVVPIFILDRVLPPELFFISLLAGAVCGAVVISATCGMSVKRAGIAAGIFLGIQVIILVTLGLIFGN